MARECNSGSREILLKNEKGLGWHPQSQSDSKNRKRERCAVTRQEISTSLCTIEPPQGQWEGVGGQAQCEAGSRERMHKAAHGEGGAVGGVTFWHVRHGGLSRSHWEC